MPATKFKFTLQPLLRARQLQEQQSQRAVAEVERQRLAMELALRRQQEHLAEGKNSMRAQLVGSVNTSELRMHASSSIAVMRMAQRTVLELAGVHRRLESARQELVESMRRRRVVELLRDRRFEQWKAEIDRLESAAIDELAVISAARKAAERSADEQAGLS